MLKEEIELNENSRRVLIAIAVDDKDIYDTLYNKNKAERIDLIKRSIKIGIVALKNASLTIDTNYMQKEIERLIFEIDNNLKANLGKEGMKGELEKTFGENGILENRLKEIFTIHGRAVADIFKDDNINSPLYKIKRFMEENSRQIDDNIYDMLDPGNKDSLLFRFKEDIIKKLEDVKRSENLDIINISKSLDNIKTDKDIFKNEITKFKEEVNDKFNDMKRSLHEEIGGVKNLAVDTNIELAKLAKEKQIVDITTLKGAKFDELLYKYLTKLAITKYGDTVDIANLSGGDRSGDYIVNINGSKDKIIIRAESTSKENVQMTDTILRHLNIAMKDRNSDYGIKVYENELPENIGPILISDNKIICSYLRGYAFEGYPLEVAYEILRTSMLRKNFGIDRKDVKMHIDNIVRLMDSLQHVSGNLTKIENLCNTTKLHIDQFRKNISDELDQVLMKSKVGKENKESKKGNKKKQNNGDNIQSEEY